MAVVANAQQEPHLPWSFTGVTTPFSLQSTDAGRSLTDLVRAAVAITAGVGSFLYPPMYCETTIQSMEVYTTGIYIYLGLELGICHIAELVDSHGPLGPRPVVPLHLLEIGLEHVIPVHISHVTNYVNTHCQLYLNLDSAWVWYRLPKVSWNLANCRRV